MSIKRRISQNLLQTGKDEYSSKDLSNMARAVNILLHKDNADGVDGADGILSTGFGMMYEMIDPAISGLPSGVNPNQPFHFQNALYDKGGHGSYSLGNGWSCTCPVDGVYSFNLIGSFAPGFVAVPGNWSELSVVSYLDGVKTANPIRWAQPSRSLSSGAVAMGMVPSTYTELYLRRGTVVRLETFAHVGTNPVHLNSYTLFGPPRISVGLVG